MPKFIVNFNRDVTFNKSCTFEIEANNQDEAYEMAYDKIMNDDGDVEFDLSEGEDHNNYTLKVEESK